MEARLKAIVEGIEEIENVEIISPLQYKGGMIQGTIKVSENTAVLDFQIEIFPSYPFKLHNIEAIRFINEDLLNYDHTNTDGSICIIPQHNPDVKLKLKQDLTALKGWITKYYLKAEEDAHYEHILLPSIPDGYSVFQFTDVNYNFSKGEHGYFTFSKISDGKAGLRDIETFIVQEFHPKKQSIKCNWSIHYQRLPKLTGIFLYIEHPPTPIEARRIAAKSWDEIEYLVSQEFLQFLYSINKSLNTQKATPNIALLIGYSINNTTIHWEAINIKGDNFPNYGEKISGKFIGRLNNQLINWLQTRNCTYDYFFGRGAFHPNITHKKILLLGAGAIGSQIAVTLARGGCKTITILDFDIKEAENICRSEYLFNQGVTSKVTELSTTVVNISPFIEVDAREELIHMIKMGDFERFSEPMKKYFEEFDIIFDCTSDNDLAYIFDKLDLNNRIFNFSISNNAQELVCVTNPNLYSWLGEIYTNLGKADDIDLYNPTGCWSPTFKASYNDIAFLVQYALKHINTCFKLSLPVRSFYVSYSEDGLTTKINQF
ncbi:MAG TPA: ThiF family adenylyltransferase [Cytophagales bacterium]|nr:ThiF family adenylyltransferase [Cytophagales bacterium]